MALTRAQLEENGWEKWNPNEVLICWGREKQDLYLPIRKGDYKLYHCHGHPRIRIIYQTETLHQCVFLGKCDNEATLKLLEDLIGIKPNIVS